MFSSIYAKLGIGLAVLVAIGLLAFTINRQVNKIAELGAKVSGLETKLATEEDARKRDVAGLTALSQGVVAAASARAVDDKILAETIDAKNPQPSSPGLAHFLDGLRASDTHRPAAPSPGGARPAARPGAGGSVH